MTDVPLDALPEVQEPGRRAELHRLWALTWTLALTDWKLKFYGSVLGVAWTLVRPFAFFGVIYVVFTEFAHLDANVHNYGIYILFAMVLFQYFAEVTGNSVNCLVTRESLLRKMQFNPIVIPLGIAVTALLNLAITFAAVMIFAFANGDWPTLTWLELPVIVLVLTMLAVGIGMLLSTLYVRYRDMAPIWEVVLQMLFYGSSILYVAAPTVPESARPWFLMNPISACFAQMRHAAIDSGAPTVTYLMGSRIVVPILLTIGIFVLGLWFFQRESPRVAENL